MSKENPYKYYESSRNLKPTKDPLKKLINKAHKEYHDYWGPKGEPESGFDAYNMTKKDVVKHRKEGLKEYQEYKEHQSSHWGKGEGNKNGDVK